jgi:hypothetical protein
LLVGIDVPGLDPYTGSGAEGGLTAVFFVVYGVQGGGEVRTGTVVRWEVEDGRVIRTDETAADAELVVE